MSQASIKPQDHPDFVGGWVWRVLEMRWIERRIAEAISAERDRIADEAKHIIKRAEARGAAAEREACAKMCDLRKEINADWGDEQRMDEARSCAAAIRARGQV